MELNEFIKDTLVGIKKGVSEANDIIGSGGRTYYINNSKDGAITFDIAVTVGEQQGETGSGSIKIAVVDIGGKLSSDNHQEQTSRIKFSVVPSIIIS